MQRSLIPAILAGLLCASTGCAVTSDGTENLFSGLPMFRTSSDDLPADIDEPEDEETVHRQIRKTGGPGGKEDRWLWDHMMSSEARSIEQNLGLE